jgi:TldD protein
VSLAFDQIEAGLLQETVARALRHGGDYADVYVEDRRSLGLTLDDGKIERASGGHDLGAAVRVTSGDRTYHAYTDDLSEGDLAAAADAVAAALRGGSPAKAALLGNVRAEPSLHAVAQPPQAVAIDAKADLLRVCDATARESDAAVSQVSAGYVEGRQRVLIATSEGDLVRDDRTRTRLTVSVVARRDGVIQQGFESLGKSRGFEILSPDVAAEMARTAAGKAVTMLAALPAPSGPMAVVLANGFGGTLFHEACGHGLEADAVVKGASVYTGKMGESIAAAHLSAYDDGTIPGEWGSAAFDDEGVPMQKTMVIEDGRLRSYLNDRLRARKMKAAPTGNGRRQSFRHVPVPRMRTTYIAPGDVTPEEIIADTKHGFYAKSLAGGQVEPASGNFVFGVAEGYLIENGRVTTPLRGATLVGSGIEILNRIDLVGDDFLVKSGMCGKDGQSVPVGTGQATLRIGRMTVGGTA